VDDLSVVLFIITTGVIAVAIAAYAFVLSEGSHGRR
jgi:hypothetical protein